MGKSRFLLTGAVVVGLMLALAIQHHAGTKLREENQALHQQNARLEVQLDTLSNRVTQTRPSRALRLPAPHLQAAAEERGSATLYARLQGKERKLPPEQVEAYLRANRRSAGSLLAAYRNTQDPALLDEAKQNSPNDPMVAFEAALQKDASPEDQRKWLDNLKSAAPENSLANYLSALAYFQAGQTDQAVEEMIAASGKAQFKDYRLERVQDAQEALLSAGDSVAEAKLLSEVDTTLPQLRPLRDLTISLVDLAKSYRQAGDDSSAQAALGMAIGIGQRYSEAPAGQPLLPYAAGLRFERRALAAMDPSAPYGDNGQTVQNQLEQINGQLNGVQQLADKWNDEFLARLSDEDWISYCDRIKVFGDEAAMRWVFNKYAQK